MCVYVWVRALLFMIQAKCFCAYTTDFEVAPWAVMGATRREGPSMYSEICQKSCCPCNHPNITPPSLRDWIVISASNSIHMGRRTGRPVRSLQIIVSICLFPSFDFNPCRSAYLKNLTQQTGCRGMGESGGISGTNTHFPIVLTYSVSALDRLTNDTEIWLFKQPGFAPLELSISHPNQFQP